MVLAAAIRAAEILGMLLDADEDAPTCVGEDRDELAGLLPLLGLERFDRRDLQPRPGGHATDRSHEGEQA